MLYVTVAIRAINRETERALLVKTCRYGWRWVPKSRLKCKGKTAIEFLKAGLNRPDSEPYENSSYPSIDIENWLVSGFIDSEPVRTPSSGFGVDTTPTDKKSNVEVTDVTKHSSNTLYNSEEESKLKCDELAASFDLATYDEDRDVDVLASEMKAA